ncbi:hypothetical protein ACKZDW_15095 [Ralstonia syzygii subsp. celebesensis]
MGGIQYFEKPITTQELFKNTNNTIEIRGNVSIYDKSRGAKNKNSRSTRGKLLLRLLGVRGPMQQDRPRGAAPEFDGSKNSKRPLLAKNAIFLHRKISTAESELIYELYLERDAGFYKLWLALAAALAGFAFWFRNRPLLGE